MKRAILAVLCITLCLFMLVGCKLSVSTPDTNVSTYEEKEESKDLSFGEKLRLEMEEKEDLSKHIEVKDAKLKNDKIALFIKNNNSKDIRVEIEVEFYDESDKLVDTELAYLPILGKNTETVEIVSTGLLKSIEYDHYKVKIKKVDFAMDMYTTYQDKVELTTNDTGKQIMIQAKNTSSETINSAVVLVLFYKGDTIVETQSGYISDCGPGETANLKIIYPMDYSTFENVEFDNFEAIVQSAYAYNR